MHFFSFISTIARYTNADAFSSADVLSEDVIIKWYKEAHSVKGKSVFLEQMSKFIEWLQSAEEGK